MTFPDISLDNVLKIFLALNQYPILNGKIRSRMRRELFARGIITKAAFDAEARRKAIKSQKREGLHDPFIKERADIWETRLTHVREFLTDFYFAYNLPYEEFENIVRQMLVEHGSSDADFIWFNPELAPQDLLFEQAEFIEAMPPEECKKYRARLQEIKVVLIRTLVSDQLKYIKLARHWFNVSDLKEIRRRKIGGGKVGGKAAGMLLAMRILKETAPPEIRDNFRTPVSYYLGSDVFYNFMSINGLMHWNDQKYKTEEQMRADYPSLRVEFMKGQFPPEIIEGLEDVLIQAGNKPLIVRSSSLLEDSFGTSFAGKYESIFCPNQGAREENLLALTNAISRVYASVMDPDALLYRHLKDLADYDERIGILIQFVEGEPMGRYYLPHAAGVAFSRNLFRWSPQIKQEDGFLRLVWGLGTRAVDLFADDYPRLVALSHPSLYPTADIRNIQRYSQRNVDMIDIEANEFCTAPIREVITANYPPLRCIAQIEQDGYLGSILTNIASPEKLVITFEGLLSRTPFAAHIREALRLLETHYDSPVDIEFTVEILEPYSQHPSVCITILQCRPQSHIQDSAEVHMPHDLRDEDIIFSTHRMVPQGVVEKIRYVLFVAAEGYFNLSTQAERTQLERAIGQLNAALKDETFIAVGPGRWGTSTPDLGVHVACADIYNARSLVELAGREIGASLEPSFGTHFFQDLMEANIYPLAVFLDEKETIFKRDFFYTTPNRLSDFIKTDNYILNTLRLIAVEDYRPGHHMDLVMDGQKSRAAAYLVSENEYPVPADGDHTATPEFLE
ncbi:MAG: PEP/pyruvate-binding domain-containing protein [Anaerolineales bacterium]|nr:PEP/pyruvate-binding domain-containing protein [Anaerolineales bacterium]